MGFNTRSLGIKMNQGDDFDIILVISDVNGPIDITRYLFFGDMKIDTNEGTPIAASFDFAILDQVSNKGQVQWSLSHDETEELIASVSDAERKNRLTTPYVFDVKMEDPDEVITRIVQGIIYLSPQVTVAPEVEP